MAPGVARALGSVLYVIVLACSARQARADTQATTTTGQRVILRASWFTRLPMTPQVDRNRLEVPR